MALWRESARLQEVALEVAVAVVGLAEGAAAMTERCRPRMKSGKSLSGQEGAHPRPGSDARIL